MSESNSKYAIVRLTGTPAAAFTLQLPAISRSYVISNETAHSATLTSGAGVTLDVQAGIAKHVFWAPGGLYEAGNTENLPVSGEYRFMPRPLPQGYAADYYSQSATGAAAYPPAVFYSSNSSILLGSARACGMRTSSGKHRFVGGLKGNNANGTIVNNHVVFDETTGNVSAGTVYPYSVQGSHIGCAAGDLCYVFGGNISVGPYYFAGSYRINADGTFSSIAALPVGTAWHGAADLGNGKILVAGGGTSDTVTVATTRIYTISSNTYANGPAMPEPRWQHGIAPLSGNRALIVGGHAYGNATWYTSCLIYDDNTGLLTETAPLPFAIARPVAATLDDGTVLVTGLSLGSDPVTGYKSPCLLFDPADETWAELPSLAELRNTPALTPIFGGTKHEALVLGGGYSPASWHGNMRNDYSIYFGASAPLYAKKL